jgi:4'-phosphopantetheinyl transferase
VRGRRDVFVSVSHTDRLAAIALARRPVGLDVEVLPTDGVDELLVRRSCTPAELRAWNRVGRSQRTSTFLRWWVRKEALVKVLRARDPSSAVTMDRLDARRRAAVRQGRLWWLTDLDLPSSTGHVGAVVTAWTPARVTVSWADDDVGARS